MGGVEALILGFRVFPSRGKSMYSIYLAHWGGWRQGCASRLGKARRGSIRPFSIGSSHCLSTGVKADVYLQCLTTLVMGGNGLSRPGGI